MSVLSWFYGILVVEIAHLMHFVRPTFLGNSIMLQLEISRRRGGQNIQHRVRTYIHTLLSYNKLFLYTLDVRKFIIIHNIHTPLDTIITVLQ